MEEEIIDMRVCPHELVFKYNNNHPRINEIDGNYYCPMCRKSIGTHSMDFFYASDFKDSRIIKLDNISLEGNSTNLSLLRQEVFDNYEFYYDSSCTDDELASRMENALRGTKETYYVLAIRKG